MKSETKMGAGAIGLLSAGMALGPASTMAQEGAAIALDPVTVTATRTPSSTRTVPASVDVVEGERLERLQAQSLDDILRDLPGVTSLGGPRAAAELPQIRGLGSDRIIMRQDGTRQNFQSGHKGRVLVNPALIKRVEVIKGPSSALYGSGALGGVISVETVDAADLLEPGEPMGALVGGSYRSANDEFGLLGAAFGQAGMVDALAAHDYRDSDDLELGDGTTLDFSELDSRSTLLKMGFEPTADQRLEVSYDRLDDSGATALNGNAVASDPSEAGDRDGERTTARIAYDLSPSLWWLDLHAVAYRTITGIEEERLSDQRLEQREVATNGVDLYNTMTVDLSEQIESSLTFGVEYFRDRNEGATLRPGADGPPDPADPEALPAFPDATGDSIGLYLQNDIRLFDRLTLLPGIRYDRFDIESESESGDVERSDDETSLKFGASLDVTDFLTLFGSYGEGFNAPRAQDLFISGLHFPGGFPLFPGGPVVPDNFFVANPDLKPERTETYEAGVRIGFDDLLVDDDALRFDITWFHTDADDFIARDVDILGGVTTLQNIDEAEIDGFEAGLRYDTGTVFAGLAYSQVRGDDLVDDGPLVDMPADEWGLDLGVRLSNPALTIGYHGTYAEEHDRVAADEPPTEDYLVHDAYVTWTGADGQLDGAEVGLRVNNLLDEDYRRAGAAIKEAGRDFRLTVNLRF
ncbi:MAG: TonB-dependent hemoglobin/transferrin/lactoferrin family receptor [Alphaproteobacteria bacterium]